MQNEKDNLPHTDNVYVVKIYSTQTDHIIKIGKSVNFDNRMKTFKTIAPELITILRSNGNEYEIINDLSKTFEKVGQELFKIPISKSDAFIQQITSLCGCNGHSDVNSFTLTGCYYSHYKTYQNIYEHRNCSNRCKFKIEYDRVQEQVRKETKYTLMVEYHKDGVGVYTNCYPSTIRFGLKELIMSYALNCIETCTIMGVYLTEENIKVGYVNYEMNGDKRSGVNLFIEDKQYYQPCKSQL